MAIPAQKYSKKEILLLSEVLSGKVGVPQLKKTRVELAALADVLLNNNKSAIAWLVKNKFHILLRFVRALKKDHNAFLFLRKSEYKEWAAVISYLNNSKSVVTWLKANKLEHYGLFAQTLRELSKENETFLLDPGGLGSDSFYDISTDGSFDGFGGGDFGGGGGGGDY